MRRLLMLVAAAAVACDSAGASPPEPPVSPWPPVVGKPYPDLKLVDQEGDRVSLSDFKGKVILVEPIGISCPGCHAFAGAGRIGSFRGVEPQKNLKSMEHYARRLGGFDLDDKRIVYVHLLLYDMGRKAPSPEEGRAWAEHFGMDRAKNRIVLVGEPDFIGPASYNLIPGIQLIDKDFILRADHTGHQPRDDLATVLKMVKPLLK